MPTPNHETSCVFFFWQIKATRWDLASNTTTLNDMSDDCRIHCSLGKTSDLSNALVGVYAGVGVSHKLRQCPQTRFGHRRLTN